MAGTPQPKKDSELPRNPAGVGETQPTSFAWLRSQFRGPASVETGDKFSVLTPITKETTQVICWLAFLLAGCRRLRREFQQLHVGR